MKNGTVSKEWLAFRRRFFIIWFLIIIIGVSFAIFTYGSLWRFYYNARITDFLICSGLDSNGHPIPVTHPITVVAKELNVCGYLEGNGPIPLAFFLQYSGESIVKPLTGHYQVSYFTVRFAAPSNGFNAGNYLILVYEGRHKLASTEFTIKEP